MLDAVLYHITPARNLPSILTRGLLPSIGPRSRRCAETKALTYYFASLDDLDNALANWLGDAFTPSTTSLCCA